MLPSEHSSVPHESTASLNTTASAVIHSHTAAGHDDVVTTAAFAGKQRDSLKSVFHVFIHVGTVNLSLFLFYITGCINTHKKTTT